MNNYINPFALMYELYTEATTISEKFLALFISFWISTLLVISSSGIGMVIYELYTNPTQFNNVTWGIFDTLG